MGFIRRLFGLEWQPPIHKSTHPRPKKKHEYGAQAAADGYDFGTLADIKKDAFTGNIREGAHDIKIPDESAETSSSES